MNEFLFTFTNRFLPHPTQALDYYSTTIQGNWQIRITSGLDFIPKSWVKKVIFLFQWWKIGSSLFKVSSLGLVFGITFRIHYRIITWRQVQNDFTELHVFFAKNKKFATTGRLRFFSSGIYSFFWPFVLTTFHHKKHQNHYRKDKCNF